jgi:hypothetical protein
MSVRPCVMPGLTAFAEASALEKPGPSDSGQLPGHALRRATAQATAV